jgi:hypothetical protein
MNSRSIDCTIKDGAGAFTLIVERGRQRFYNADTIRATIDGDGEFSRLCIIHPPGSPLCSTEYRLVGNVPDVQDDLFEKSVLEVLFTGTGELNPKYSGYRIVGRNPFSAR